MLQAQKTFSCEWLGRTLSIETGKFAWQADFALTVRYGDTVVLATVVEDKEDKPSMGFFPLMVELEERLYAAGIIKGSQWIKREGRPSDDTVLTGRMIDRSIRPLFNQFSTRAIQVSMTVLSVDQENDHDIVSLIAASAVLSLSQINWNGPLAGIRVGRINGQLVLNPTYKERLESDLDLIVAGTAEKSIMIEAGAKEVNTDDMFQAISAGQDAMQPAIELIKKAQKELGINKVFVGTAEVKQYDEAQLEANKLAEDWLAANIPTILFDKTYYTKKERKLSVKAIKDGLKEYLTEVNVSKEAMAVAVSLLAEPMIEAEVTRAIIEDGRRVDGRKLNEIRELTSEVALVPRVHGVGLFSRGETQVLSVVTLGAAGDKQSLDGLEGKSEKRYMHHYNFPAFSVGEAKPNRGTGRREIGHGALAEKAIEPLLPSREEFPYTIRVVSETLSSNGSSSMGSTCGSSLALMDAGVPLKRAVAGIAIGLASNHDMSRWEIITDIQDLEDGAGGMDFKITGTTEGLTAIQLDTKTDGLTKEMVEKALRFGKEAILQILDVMNKAISAPRAELSPYAPRITSFFIAPDKIREVIGSGGKVINEIIAACEVQIDIEDDGMVMICGVDAEKTKRAVDWVKDIVREFKAGEVFAGKVVRMLDFGAFVALPGNHDGMVHVSEMAPYRVSSPDKFLAIGDAVTVRIKEVDEQGRINLSMKACPENAELWKAEKGKDDRPAGAPRFGDRPTRDGGGGGRGSNDRPRRFNR